MLNLNGNGRVRLERFVVRQPVARVSRWHLTIGTDRGQRCAAQVFQPHTYSRLAQFFDDFVPAFGGAQRVLVTDVFGAREEAVERGGGEGGVWDAEALAEAIEGPAAAYMPTIQDAVERVVWELKASQLIGEQEPPVIISMGAGDITCLGERLVQRIKGEIEFLD